MSNEITTKDGEWTHEELYGVAYDECMHACEKIPFLLDKPNLDKPNVLMDTIMDELGDMNLVDYYDKFYADKVPHESSDEVFNKWDNWMQDRIRATIQAHKHPLYIK